MLNVLYDLNRSYEERLGPMFKFIIEKKMESMGANRSALMEIDPILENFEPSRSDNIMGVGLIRATSQMKDLLPHWHDCRDRVATHLDSQGLDTIHILRGLYK
jgi:hypothetical protein